ncbi:MAG TPA: UDP-3-O-(3-hydroxymyristoyl)glucosamine N-acyltransferase [Terracidiphilus sp.]|nr:UDP-3-O-(3-hydroxymyristoyl)glucosamine N-acyltransferase [Terracidiphilus sp.]
MTLGELIQALGGKLVQGTPEWQVDGVSSAAFASPSDVVFAEDAPSAQKALAGYAGVVVLRPGALACPPDRCIVEADQPRLWFARAARLLKPPQPAAGVHPTAVLGAHVQLAEAVSIGPHVVLDDYVHVGAGTRVEAGAVLGCGVRVGELCRIYPRAVLYSGTILGNRVVVHAGAVLGADGFGYVRDAVSGAYTQFPQQGTLTVEDDVEIGANSTIDRGALAETRIRRGVKIDNLVHIGHNCDIGEDVILVALTGISGSSSIGKGAVLAGQVGIGDHVKVGAGVILGGQAGVFTGATVTNAGLKPGTVLWGTPARPLKQVLREQAVLARLARRSGVRGKKEQGTEGRE